MDRQSNFDQEIIQFIIRILKHFTNKTHELNSYLRMATFSYNTCIHEGTKYISYELVFCKTLHISARTKFGGESNIRRILPHYSIN